MSSTLVARMLDIALEQRDRRGLNELLKAVAEEVDADACILWEASPSASFKKGDLRGDLCILDQWVDEEVRPTCLVRLPIEESITGEVVMRGHREHISDTDADPRNYDDPPFHKEDNIRSMCCIPLEVRSGVHGALNLYWKGCRDASLSDLKAIEGAVQLLPRLQSTIRDRLQFDLLQFLHDLLEGSRLSDTDEKTIEQEIRSLAKKICDRLADGFQSVETTIFFCSPGEQVHDAVFRSMASSWGTIPEGASTYEADSAQGLTGWVLEHEESVRIYDLARFERDREFYTDLYPEIHWKDSLDIQKSIRSRVGLAKNDPLPPISFLAVPIRFDSQVVGVFRCTAAKAGPYYFSEDEQEMLESLSRSAGNLWRRWRDALLQLEKRKIRDGFVEVLKCLNTEATRLLQQENEDPKHLYKVALESLADALPGADTLSVRLHDPKNDVLTFYAVWGEAWNKGSGAKRAERLARSFPVKGEPRSIGQRVYNEKEAIILDNPSDDPDYSATFPEVKALLVAPIIHDREVLGVLDIRTTHSERFSDYARRLAELLGSELGLYRRYLKNNKELRDTRQLLRDTQKDLAHQLKSPIFQIRVWGDTALRRYHPLPRRESPDALHRCLFAIRGLSSKAKRVVNNMRFFIDLMDGKTPRLEFSDLDSGDLTLLAIQAAADQDNLTDPDKKMRFVVDRGGFSLLDKKPLHANKDLLEQALSNLLDNAAKYSKTGTTVKVYGKTTRSGAFSLTVENAGVPFDHDWRRLLERGVRGPHAQYMTAEGSGIGLWIVDQIMRAHDGEVLLQRRKNGMNRVRLIFRGYQP